MTSAAEELQAALIAALQHVPEFGKRVGERWAEPRPGELPCARVGVTEVVEAGRFQLLATVHIWQQPGAMDVIDAARKILNDAPPVEARPFSSWQLVFTEIRPDEEIAGERVLLRYRGQGTIP